MKNEKHLLVLTATVIPQIQTGIFRNDPNQRLEDYATSISTLSHQLRKKSVDIVVAENSGQIDRIKESVKKLDCRFIQCPTDLLSRNSGISGGEHEILRYVGNLLDLTEVDVIWKLTGRLSVKNISSILDESSGDLRANVFFRQHHSVDSRFFGMTPEVFRLFTKTKINYSERYEFDSKSSQQTYKSIEYYLAKFALEIESRGFIFHSLPYLPIYQGYSASTGKLLDSRSVRFKTKIANTLRPLIVKGLLGVNP